MSSSEKNNIILHLSNTTKMKQLHLTISFLLLSFLAIAQQETAEEQPNLGLNANPRMETLSKAGSTHGIYLGIGGGFSEVAGNTVGQFHARLAYVADQTFEFGFEGQSYQGITRIKDSDTATLTAGGLGGIHLKGILYGNKKIHVGIPLFLGFGAFGQETGEASNIFDDFEAEFESITPAFVMTPGVNIEFNINKFMGAEFGIRYRLASTFDVSNDTLNDLNGWTVEGTFKFGFFDFGGKNKTHKQKTIDQVDDTYRNY